MCVIGNKTDLCDDRKVSKEEASEYAESIGGFYFECSAASDHGRISFRTTKRILILPKQLFSKFQSFENFKDLVLGAAFRVRIVTTLTCKKNLKLAVVTVSLLTCNLSLT